MLSPDDADLARRDPTLPGLATLLDPDAIAAALSDRLDLPLAGIVPTYVRYKPGTSCLVAYRDKGSAGRILFHATTFAACLEDKVEKARARERRGGLGTVDGAPDRFLYLESSRTAVAVHPFDAALPAMARLDDPATRSGLLARIFRDEQEGPVGDVVALAYKPGRRFVGRVDWSDGRRAVVRLYANAASARELRLPRGLRSGGVLRIARRLGGSKRHQAVAVEWLAGQSFRDLVRSRAAECFGCLEEVVRAVGELHRTPIDAGDRLRPRALDAGLPEAERELSWLDPSLASLAASLRSRIASRLARIAPVRRLVHGDLYDKQIVVDSGGVGLVDLDELGIGDPRLDLGLMLAHWERDRLFGDLDGDDLSLVSQFRARSAESEVDPVDELELFAAAGLLRLAQQPFRMRIPDWRRLMSAMLGRVGELLDS